MKTRWEEADTSPLSLDNCGEDHTYGGASGLSFDPLPTSAHGRTLKALLPDIEFARLEVAVLERANGKCECCEGAKATIVHPRYEYNIAK